MTKRRLTIPTPVNVIALSMAWMCFCTGTFALEHEVADAI